MLGFPFVTALCLTRNRPQWLQKAIRYFQAQTYPSKELLIVADGDDVRGQVPDDDRIRLIHIEEGYTIGAKRNFGVSHARGEIIAHWDDDDYSAPGRLADQVGRLGASGLAVTGYHSMLFTDGAKWWKYGKSVAIGTSLAYRKSWWEGHPFPALQIAEDYQFATAADGAGQLTATDPAGVLMAATIHNGNTSHRDLTGGSYVMTARPEGLCNPFD